MIKSVALPWASRPYAVGVRQPHQQGIQTKYSQVDKIHFSAYPGDRLMPEQVQVLGASLSQAQKRTDLEKIENLQTFLAPHAAAGNVHGRVFACRLEAELPGSKKLVSQTVNFFLIPGVFSCDFMNGVIDLWHQSKGQPFTITTAYFISGDIVNGSTKRRPMPIPCADCQNWMYQGLVNFHSADKAGRMFRIAPNFQMKRFYEKEGQNILEVTPLNKIIPVHQYALRQVTSWQMPREGVYRWQEPTFSDRADTAREQLNVKPRDVQELMLKAKESWENNRGSGLAEGLKEETPEGVAILFNDGSIETSGRTAFSTIRPISADERAMANGLQRFALQGKDVGKVSARIIAYYGFQPSVKTLGTIGRYYFDENGPERNTPTLIATVENGQIYVRTLKDYSPVFYKPSKKK